MKIVSNQSVEDLQSRTLIKDRSKETIENFEEDGHSVIEVFHGTKAMMCPNCFNYTLIDVEYTQTARVKKNDTFIYSIPNISFTTDIACTYCGAITDMIDIDPNIAESVKILNRKGYMTRFCCEGHSNDSVSPYIMFKHKYIVNNILDTLPDSWYIDMDDIKNSYIGNYGRITIRGNRFDKINTLNDLEDWARSLPKASEFLLPKLKKYIENYGFTLPIIPDVTQN